MSLFTIYKMFDIQLEYLITIHLLIHSFIHLTNIHCSMLFDFG